VKKQLHVLYKNTDQILPNELHGPMHLHNMCYVCMLHYMFDITIMYLVRYYVYIQYAFSIVISVFVYMFVPLYILVNSVFVLMGRMAYWILK